MKWFARDKRSPDAPHSRKSFVLLPRSFLLRASRHDRLPTTRFDLWLSLLRYGRNAVFGDDGCRFSQKPLSTLRSALRRLFLTAADCSLVNLHGADRARQRDDILHPVSFFKMKHPMQTQDLHSTTKLETLTHLKWTNVKLI